MAVSDIRGNVDTIILKVLFEGDRYGYDMIKAINARGGGQWEIKQPTLYARLKSLEKQGFISSYRDSAETGGGARKYYTLTDRGREVFVTYRAEFERTRDLFTDLITGDPSPVQFDDDFSDIKDESYEIPKKRRPRPVRKEKKREEAVKESVQDLHADSDDNRGTELDSAKDSTQAQPFSPVGDDEFSDRTMSNEYVVDADIQEPDYVQQSFFSFVDGTAENAENENAKDIENIESAKSNIYTTAAAKQPEHNKQSKPRITSTVDPHELVSRIYSSSVTDKRSYFDSGDKSSYEDDIIDAAKPEQPKQPAPPTPPSPPAPPTTPTTPAPPSPVVQSTNLAPVNSGGAESLARREYRDILGDLIERSEAEQSKLEQGDRQPVDEVASSDERFEVRKFSDVIASVEELGDHVEVRDHNDSAKQYNHQYYYYSHKLLFTHYAILCGAMLALGLTLYFLLRLGLGLRQRYDYLLFIFTGLVPIAMFITAIAVFASSPDKKKRINVNFRFSIIIRLVIMVQAAVVVYCLNIIWGMPVGFSAAYVPSLVIPAVYALFIPLSEVIFMNLLKSERYAVAE